MWRSPDVLDFYAHEFDFSNQHKTSYDDWIKTYEQAVKKRAVDGCFVGLSSGYDSGALCHELKKQGIKFRAYSIRNNENEEVLSKRIVVTDDVVIATLEKSDYDRLYEFLKTRIKEENMRDIASMGVAYAFETASKEGRKVFLANQGADEIISDYALYPGQSTYKGVFPKELKEWKNFKEGKNREYINQLEDIAELYNIEVRYPMLDIDLVQEFLWLSAELKNAHYKAPLREYLVRNEIPFEEGVKRGFNPIKL